MNYLFFYMVGKVDLYIKETYYSLIGLGCYSKITIFEYSHNSFSLCGLLFSIFFSFLYVDLKNFIKHQVYHLYIIQPILYQQYLIIYLINGSPLVRKLLSHRSILYKHRDLDLLLHLPTTLSYKKEEFFLIA